MTPSSHVSTSVIWGHEATEQRQFCPCAPQWFWLTVHQSSIRKTYKNHKSCRNTTFMAVASVTFTMHHIKWNKYEYINMWNHIMWDVTLEYTRHGEQVLGYSTDIDAFTDHTVIVLFWFSDCPECHKMATPHCDHMDQWTFSMFCFCPTVLRQQQTGSRFGGKHDSSRWEIMRKNIFEY